MQMAAKDDQAAFERLVIRHQNPLLNFFIRSGVYTDAEDLVQQTFIIHTVIEISLGPGDI